MFLTFNAIYYALGGILFVVVFGNIMPAPLAFLLYNFLFAAAIFADFYFTPGPKMLQVRREIDDKLSLGTENSVVLVAENLSRYKIRVEIKDECPDELPLKDLPVKIELEGYGGGQNSYTVSPRRRGEYDFGALHVRVFGLLGIAGRQFKKPADQKVKVYPNIKEISQYRLLARKGRLLEAGLKPSKIYGFGSDFEYLRDYVPDDEFRKVNWKATARKNRLITSQYQTERSQNIILMIDAGRMMTSRINDITKLDYAINAALLLGYVAMDKGDNVGLLVFSNEVMKYLPPKRGGRQLSLLIESLYNVEPAYVEPEYGKAFSYLLSKNRKRSLITIFTDLIDTEVSKSVVLYSRSLYPAHLPLCVAIADPALYSEAEQFPQGNISIYHKAVAEDLISQREQVKKVLKKGGVLTLDTPPEKLTPNLITRYLSIKARNRL